MQSVWRMAVFCVRGSVRGACSRSSLSRKLLVLILLCGLSLLIYYRSIDINITKITGDDLGAVSNLQSFTEISRQYPEQRSTVTSSHSPQYHSLRNGSVLRGVLLDWSKRPVLAPSTHTEDLHVQTASAVMATNPSAKVVFRSPITSNGAKLRQKKIQGRKLPQVLLVYGVDAYKHSIEIKIFLEAYRIPFLHVNFAKGAELISRQRNASSGRISGTLKFEHLSLVIIVTDIHSKSAVPYLDFCRDRKLPMIWAVLPTLAQLENSAPVLPNLETVALKSDEVVHVSLSETYPFYYARPGAPSSGNIVLPSGKHWTTFTVKMSGDSHMTPAVSNSSTVSTTRDIDHKSTVDPSHDDSSDEERSHNYRSLVHVGTTGEEGGEGGVKFRESAGAIEDMGRFDGVRKILIGTHLRFWLTHLVLLDAVHVLCEGVDVVRAGRERMVMVDIDDIFLAPEGRRMTAEDVQAMMKVQSELRQLVPGFTFNAGFVGGYYSTGSENEKLGNQELVRNADQLRWFGHTFKHHQPHEMTFDGLLNTMKMNKQFAKDHGIPVSHYSVAPHHSGVYPVHTPLYDAWKEVWNVSVTTTEEYPSLRPDHKRRGFIHRGIRVLPRQTCRLFTHTYLFDHFTGGREKVVAIAAGGEVFLTLLRNPVSVFMTHTPNYCCDRLALLLFSSLFTFTAQWTQLQLTTPTPDEMADRYFHLYPEDEAPVWTSPCNDKRHLEIWPAGHNCSRLPSLLILGPQKSGTTAIYTFLKHHQQVSSNRDTELHFEEVQFFSDDSLYQQGIDWYMDQFPYPPPHTSSPSSPHILFEKSATYLSHPLAPLRAHSLLPRAKLLVILADPAKRAYSWYQHQRAHSDPAAMQYSFTEVLRASSPSPSTPPSLTTLSHHCLTPAHYHQHITHWLNYYDKSQLLLVDGDDLVQRPADIMDSVQKFLNIPYINYHSILQYDSRKRFYCIIDTNGRKNCLGKGKGRVYPAMTSADQQWLTTYYSTHNSQLRNLLIQLGHTPPRWLLISALTN